MARSASALGTSKSNEPATPSLLMEHVAVPKAHFEDALLNVYLLLRKRLERIMAVLERTDREAADKLDAVMSKMLNASVEEKDYDSSLASRLAHAPSGSDMGSIGRKGGVTFTPDGSGPPSMSKKGPGALASRQNSPMGTASGSAQPGQGQGQNGVTVIQQNKALPPPPVKGNSPAGKGDQAPFLNSTQI